MTEYLTKTNDCNKCINIINSRSDYSYYACTAGWGFHDGWSKWSADYDRPLGAPNGTAVKTKTGWRRSFAGNGVNTTNVWLDTADQTDTAWGKSCIVWADGHKTSSGGLKACSK